MLKALQPDSPFVRYGTTLATVGRLAANTILLNTETPYAIPAIASNVTGLVGAHTKAGVAAEAALALCALTAITTTAAMQLNPLKMWMGGVGMIAYGNALSKNIRYTKICPKAYRLYEQPPEKTPVPAPAYTQTVKSEPNKAERILRGLSIAPWVKKGAEKLQQSNSPWWRDFGKNLQEITQRPMFGPGMTSVVGITPFIVNGIIQGCQNGDWSGAIGGGIILGANLVSSASIPQKQNHPLVALFHATRDYFTGKKDATSQQPRNSGLTN